jgi:hypothetical protein
MVGVPAEGEMMTSGVWPMLAADHAASAGHTAVGVLHVRGALLVADGNEPDPRRGEEIQHVHEGGANDAADMVHPFRNQSFDNRLAGCHFYFFHF